MKRIGWFILMFAAIGAGVAPSARGQAPEGVLPSASSSAAFEQDGIKVVASIKAQIYSWTVINVDAPPIMRFSIPEQNTYNQNIPPGWKLHVKGGIFTASTDDERLAIHRGQTRTFDARTGSAGSMLGPVPLTLGFSADGEDVVVPNVWGPVPKRRNIVVLVAGTVMLIGLFHVAALRRVEARKLRPAAAG